MSYSFGWWDYVEGERPAMVNRFSGERIVMGAPLSGDAAAKASAAHPGMAVEPWTRFDYEHDEFRFPLAVFWQPDQGRILVDYNISSEIWRRDSSTDAEHPRYGGWVRVDDMVPDAFWCWPGVLDVLVSKFVNEDISRGIAFRGAWIDASWNNDVRSLEKVGHYNLSLDDDHDLTSRVRASIMAGKRIAFDDASVIDPPVLLSDWTQRAHEQFLNNYRRTPQWARTMAKPIDAPPPCPWEFYANTIEALEKVLNENPEGRRFAVSMVPLLPGNRMPCAISRDRRRLFHPVEPDSSGYRFYYRSTSIASDTIQLRGSERESMGRGKRFGFSFVKLGPEPEPEQERPDPCELTVEQGNSLRRDITTALFAWTGTDEKPSSWTEMDQFVPRNEFEHSKFITAEVGTLGGRRCLGRQRHMGTSDNG